MKLEVTAAELVFGDGGGHWVCVSTPGYTMTIYWLVYENISILKKVLKCYLKIQNSKYSLTVKNTLYDYINIKTNIKKTIILGTISVI